MKALTQIRHGKPDGDVVTLEPGDDIPGDLFTNDEKKSLIAAGAVGTKYDPDAPAVRPENTPDVEEKDAEPSGDGRRAAKSER